MNGSNGRPAATAPAAPRPGGRVLGRPIPNRTLSPAIATRPQLAVSPSESSTSFASQSSTPQKLPESGYSTPNGPVGQYNLGDGGVGGAEDSSRMICPICQEDMVTLLQLNRHLDNDHKEVEEVEKDDIQTWFRRRMQKAKQFQPVALINQTLKGIDVFESNDNLTPTSQLTPTAAVPSSTISTPLAPVVRDKDPEEYVTRNHWQKPSVRDLCTEPACGKVLGSSNGTINCRKCGKLFCDEHTMYQIKLSRSAQHEPVRGTWCRVCETCYMSRDGYLDHKGSVIDHTDEFAKMRRKRIDKQHLETSRLDKRLTKLTQLLTDPNAANNLPQQTASSLLWPMNGLRNQRKLLEQSVIQWEDDATVANCPFCQQIFTNFSLRKHHCRLCGRVVCGDLRTGCSSEVGLNVKSANSLTEKIGDLPLDVRICKECYGVVFSRRDFHAELAKKPPDLRTYETMVQFEKGIIVMLPRFQKLLQSLQDPDKIPTPQQRQEASKTRKRLLDTFTQYDTAAKRILNLPTDSPTQQQLQRSIYMNAVEFLQTHMLPLKALPKVLKQAKQANNQAASRLATHRTISSVSQLSIDDASSITSSNPEVDAEEKLLKEQLAVLEEQRFLVGEMITSAKAGRRFEEISALAQSLADLDREISTVDGRVKDFEQRNGIR